MALGTVFRRASATVATIAFCVALSRVSFRIGALSAERLILGSQLKRAVTKTTEDEDLISLLQSQIECYVTEEDAPQDNVLEEKQESFPFQVIDTPGERTVLLQRKFEDETIKIKVNTSDDDDDDDEEDAAEQEAKVDEVKIRIPMVVSVAKGDGVCLEFEVTAYLDEIVIDSLSIKQPEGSDNDLAYDGPDFDALDENLQKGFQKYLEIRGIKPSFTGFLADNVAKKDRREYLQWLQDLKSFVQK